jgi:hypothetical protein
MLYLVLFSTLALGFYAATTTAVQVSHNDEQVSRAFLASESGMDFMRFHLARVSIPPSTTGNASTAELANDLKARLESTGNMPGLTVAASGSVIHIPAEPDRFIKLDSAGNAGFRATITDWPEQGKVVLKVAGRYGSTMVSGRAIQMDFTRVPKESSIFDHAVASKGQIVMQKNAITSLDPANSAQATVMSAMNMHPSILVTGGSIGGKLTVMQDTGSVVVTGGSIAGETNIAAIMANHVKTTDTPPEFPYFDTEPYRAFTTGTTTGANANTTIKNVRVPAGTNPKFNGGATIQGILYIESPNEVTINGNLNLNGFIVFEGEGDTSVNKLMISGNMTTGPLPSGAEFDAVRAASGVAILGPTMHLETSGNARGTLKGNVVVGSVAAGGNAADIIIDHGTLVVMDEAPNSAVFNGKTIKFNGTGANNLPKVGMTFAQAYDPEPESYEELLP